MNKRFLNFFLVFILSLGLVSLACGVLNSGNEENNSENSNVENNTETNNNEDSADENDAEADDADSNVENTTEEEEPAEEEAVEEEAVEEEEEPEPTQEPVEEVEEEEPVEEEEEEEPVEEEEEEDESSAGTGFADLDFDSLGFTSSSSDETFDSYNLVIDIQFVGESGSEWGMQMGVIEVTDPRVSNISITAKGIPDFDEFGGEIVIGQEEGSGFMSMSGFCIPMTGADLEDFDTSFVDELLEPTDILDALSEGELVEEGVEMNGVITDHYHFEGISDDDDDEEESSDFDIEEGEGDLYIAQDGQYIVKLVIEGTGNVDMFDTGVQEPGDIYMEISMMDVNSVDVDAVPTSCDDVDVEAPAVEYPVVDDAFDEFALMGLVTYKTNLSADDVVAFYLDALPAEGWEYNEDESLDSLGILSFSNADGATLSVIIEEDAEEVGVTSVTLFTDEAMESLGSLEEEMFEE